MKSGKFVITNIGEFVNEQHEVVDNIAVKKYDVVKTLKPDRNGFHGVGVIERIEGDDVYIAQLRSWINALGYDGSDWERKNVVRLSLDNVVKVTESNFNSLSIDSQKEYNTYIHLLKKYLEA